MRYYTKLYRRSKAIWLGLGKLEVRLSLSREADAKNVSIFWQFRRRLTI